MKTLFYIALFLPGLIAAQSKKDNCMYVQQNKPYHTAMQSAIIQGYAIANQSNEHGYINTHFKDVSGELNLKVKLNIVVLNDSTLRITGTMGCAMDLNNSTLSTNTIAYRGAKGSPMRKAWAEMQRFALSFGGVPRYGVL